MRVLYTAVAVLLAAVANAQGLPNIPACALSCFVAAFKADGCSSLTDFACHCSKPNLQSAITPCAQSVCSPADQAIVASTVMDTCAKVGHPLTINSPAVGGSKASSEKDLRKRAAVASGGSSMGSSMGSLMGSSMGSSMGSPMGSLMATSTRTTMGSLMGGSMATSTQTTMGSLMGGSMATSTRTTMGSSMGSPMGSSMPSKTTTVTTKPTSAVPGGVSVTTSAAPAGSSKATSMASGASSATSAGSSKATSMGASAGSSMASQASSMGSITGGTATKSSTASLSPYTGAAAMPTQFAGSAFAAILVGAAALL